MNIRKTIALVAATGGLALAGAGMASADASVAQSATDSSGVITGNDVGIPVNAPINVCGDSVGVVGVAFKSACQVTEDPDQQATAAGSTNGDNGVISGNNIQVPVNLPINVVGDSVGVLGVAFGSEGTVNG